MTLEEIDLLLAADKRAPSAARRSLDALDGALKREQLEHARLLVTEVVTNSVLHGEPDPEEKIRLRVTRSGELVRVEVTDPGPGFEKPSFAQDPPPPNGVSGRGLYLVETLSERWGVSGGEPTCVWFELARAPDAPE